MFSPLHLSPLLLALPLVGAGDAPAEHPFETDAHRVPATEVGAVCLIKGATVHTATRPAFVGDVLVRDGRIVRVSESLEAPEGATVLDATGMHLAPGVVDCHSHMAIERGINEGTLSITAEVTIQDSVDCDDIAIYRALAGGCTTARLLHGSANAIGGRDAVIKLRWHAESADELLFEGARQGIKFALGENPKRSNWGEGNRFPATRMGVESIYYRAFSQAERYAAEWAEYREAKGRGEDPVPPRRDLRLEVLAGIVSGDVDVHSHCYRADEILMLVRACQSFGITIKTLQHVLEGYKVAAELAEAGVGASAFSDWWAYKIEAYDAVPQAASIMHDAGVLTSINSDSDEMVRRLYEEAAKSVRYAGMDRVAALQLVTLAPAKQLGLGERVGSIEEGKDADLVLLNGDPFSSLSRVEWTMVDGVLEFERRDAFGLDQAPPASPERVAAFPAGSEEAVFGRIEAAATSGSSVTAFVGATLHPVSGPAIENGVLLVQDGVITSIGTERRFPDGATVVDLQGKHIWPGMISMASLLGLHEIGAVKATNDSSEIGGNQPDLRVAASLNADSAHLGISRWNGITRAQPSPDGRGPLRGQSAVIDLDGLTWEELLTVDRDMLHVSFPRRSGGRRWGSVTHSHGDEDSHEDEEHELDALGLMGDDGHVHDDLCEHLRGGHDCHTSGRFLQGPGSRGGRGSGDSKGYEESEAIQELAQQFEDALEYGRLVDLAGKGLAEAPELDPRLAALVPYARGERRVALHASDAQTILDALRFADETGLDAVLYGASEGWKVADRIARCGVPVVIGSVWDLPRSPWDPYDAAFANAAVMSRAGVLVAICTADSDNERNLPFHAATAAAFGLPAEEAVRAVTLYPARILGLDGELGSLDAGKRADLVVTDGHLLEITSQVEHVFIDGRRVDHDDNRHTRLANRYRTRLEQLKR